MAGLEGIDFSGVTGNISYVYDFVGVQAMAILGLVIVFFFFIWLVSIALSKTKSKEYRELLAR